jgi:L-arabinonolactonase
MPCWSPDDKIFYAAETWEDVFAYDYDIETGSISNKRAIVDMRNNPGGSDGSTVDEEGFIWNAQVITGKLIRYAPDGSVDRSIDFPVKNLTSVSFGGPNLDALYVTSMRRIAHPANGKFSRPNCSGAPRWRTVASDWIGRSWSARATLRRLIIDRHP